MKLYEDKVTSIDISHGMKWLVAGYRSGTVALWDVQNYKLEKLIRDEHKSEVTNVKIYFVGDTKKKEINIVTAEA